jgi:sulfur carrier protein ThiS
MVTVFIERTKANAQHEFSGKISALLERLGVNPETIVVVKNGAVVSEDERCGDGDELKLLSVISGG